ncbi:AGE family epimerase/isomerase [Pacificoceanicola onchidii]|uniref:AGE family epimerase/isomerase n=1 Tax=Pacificoceanicola onchidii TaxID=2562685 RepID=UPI0010A32BDC|nr:AGE family epimerase/isomerase [Pacificoceanicola onchidii]
MALPLASQTDKTWLTDPVHRRWLAQDALRLFEVFRASLGDKPGFHVLDYDGAPLPDTVQELHTTTRLVHSYALGKAAGVTGCDEIIDQGMRYLQSHHHDKDNGGYLWALDGDAVHDSRKLAYGHVFVLLAGSSAKLAGHPDADAVIDDVTAKLDQHYWEDGPGLFADEWNRDWTPFSTYRGMNANMHGVEALLGAFEATGREVYLSKAGRILDFFMGQMAPDYDWRLPEHYTSDWEVDPEYSGNPMFRPAGTTPGHSFELARLQLQHWDLSGRPDGKAVDTARAVAGTALADAWRADGGLAYTLNFDGTPAIPDRYWWPVCEAIGVYASLLKIGGTTEDEAAYRKLWQFAEGHFVDHAKGGWFPELGEDGKPTARQFHGKPDIYHALQADLFPLTDGISRYFEALPNLAALTAANP